MRQSRGGILAIVAGVLAVGTAAVFVLSQVGSAEPDPPVSMSAAPTATSAPTPLAAPTQRTLLLQVTNEQGRAVADVLIATGGDVNGGSRLFLSPITLVPVPRPTPLEATTGSADTLQAKNGVSMLLGVRVDASVALNRLALAALVDAVGGVPIAVRESVRVTDESGAVVETVPLGARTLDGLTATTYALALQPGEPQSVRMRRFSEVLGRVLSGLPSEPEAMRQLVLSLGSLAKSTASNDELVDLLLLIQAESAAATVQGADLPTTTLRANGAAVMTRPEGPALVEALMPGARLRPGQASSPRIQLVRSGLSIDGVLKATTALIDAGFTVLEGPQGPRAETRIILPDATPESVQLGADAARALSLPLSVVRIEGGATSATDLVVLLGSDSYVL